MSETQTLEQLFGPRGDGDNAPPPSESLTVLAAQYLLLDSQVEEAQKQVADMKSNRDQAEIALINAMEQQKLKSFRLESNGALITSVLKSQFALPLKSQPEQRAQALKWLKRVGAGDLIELGIHPSTLTAFLRERAEENKPISELIKITPLRSLSVRRGK